MSRLIHRDEILVKQPHMSMGLYVALIITMMTVQWMTLDMYLPALPVLKVEFGVSEAALNASLNSDLILCAVGTLVGGTISDKYGRKPVLLIGLFLAVATLFAAAASPGVVYLTIMRGLTGLGGGFALTVAAAIIRDSFSGFSFQRVTTFSQAAAIIGPILAPAVGSFLIEYLSWRWIFIVLGIATLITALPFLFTVETWPRERREVNNIWQATIGAFSIAKSRDYLMFLAVMLLLTVPQWAYLGVCSYIYYDDFGVTNLQYSIYYAIAAIAAFFAPFIYLLLTRWITNRRITEVIMVMLAVATLLLAVVAPRGAILFLIAIIPLTMAEAMARPMSMVIILDQYPKEAGAASAVTGFALMIIGTVATAIATLPWSSFLFGMTLITAGSLILALILWIVIIRQKLYARQLNRHR